MLFWIEISGVANELIPEEAHTDLSILERDNLEESIIYKPGLLAGDLLINYSYPE